MDGFNRPTRPTRTTGATRPTNPTRQQKRHIAIKDEDETLSKLYRDSEYTEKSLNQEITDLVDETTVNEEDVPVKKSAKKAEIAKTKKAGKREKRRRLIKRIIIATLIFALIATGAYFIFRASTSSESSDFTADATAPDEIYYSVLTGNEVSDKNLATGATTCIMIENSTDSRPQSGLDEAGVIYEVIAEGGITRFMAVYQESKPQYIGPVRSVRLTFAELAKPYQCGIAHVGGSTNALNLIRNSSNGYRDLDQFFNGNYYWRISSRQAPHNVYTSFEKLDQLSFNKGFTSSNFSGFARVNPDTRTIPEERNATTVRINMSSTLYNPVYTYDANTNSYRRAFASGGTHYTQSQNGTRKELAPKVVIAMKSNAVARSGDSGNRDYTTIGSGDAFIFQNGTVITGQWRRTDTNSELHFVDQNGSDIPLERGQTWISVYPAGTGSVTWNK